MNFRITCGMTKGQNKKLCVSEIFSRVLSSGSFTLSCCYLFLSGGPASPGCHKVRERVSCARRKLARLVGREGGKERKQKIILVCTFCLKDFMTIRLFVLSRVLRDSTPRFVRRSVGRLVGWSHFTFFIRFIPTNSF